MNLCTQEASGAVGFQQLRERGVPRDVPEERRVPAVRLSVRLQPGGGRGRARVPGVFPAVRGVSVLIKHHALHKETLRWGYRRRGGGGGGCVGSVGSGHHETLILIQDSG